MSNDGASTLLIVGAGYTGRSLAELSVADGWEVFGTTRKAATKADLEAIGAQAIYWDIAEDGAEALDVSSAGRLVAVYSIPTIFEEWKPAPEGQVARHVAPVLSVLARLEELGAERFVYISSTSVFGDADGAWVDETAERAPTSPYGKMRRDIEDAVLAWPGEVATFVVRAVGIYGPGRTLDRYIEKGRYKLVDGGKKPGNRIHVDDLAGICLSVAGGTFDEPRDFIATDGDPRPVRELVDWLVEHQGIERPEEVSLEAYAEERGANSVARWTNVSRFKADRVKKALGYEFKYPSALDGYAAIFGVDQA